MQAQLEGYLVSVGILQKGQTLSAQGFRRKRMRSVLVGVRGLIDGGARCLGLVCRLFAGGTLMLRTMLPPRAGCAVGPRQGGQDRRSLDQSFVLCPHCQHRAQVWGDVVAGAYCRCPRCGPVPVEAANGVALALDEEWLRDRAAPRARHRKPRRHRCSGRRRVAAGRARRSPVCSPAIWRGCCTTCVAGSCAMAGSGIPGDHAEASASRGSPFGAGVDGWRWRSASPSTAVGSRSSAPRRPRHSGHRSSRAGERAVLGGLQVGDAAGRQRHTDRFTDGRAKVVRAL